MNQNIKIIYIHIYIYNKTNVFLLFVNRINSTDEPINYSYSIDSNKKNNDKLDESKIYCIDQRIKNVEQVLQNIADTKYNEGINQHMNMHYLILVLKIANMFI